MAGSASPTTSSSTAAAGDLRCGLLLLPIRLGARRATARCFCRSTEVTVAALGLLFYAHDARAARAAAATAAYSGITTVANFRQLDMAHGGQGAPLAPALHRELFLSANQTVAVINLGGIANITWLSEDSVIGFDVGPASCLMDGWVMRHQSQPYDDQGQWAASGQVVEPLLAELLQEPFLHLPGPKSTGRELFNLQWLDEHLAGTNYLPEDIQRTLLQFTVECIKLGFKQVGQAVDQVVVCGGGTHNRQLMLTLAEALEVPCQSSAAFGVDPDFVEATLMAWMAERHLADQRLDLRSITGADKPLLYGVRYEPA